MPGGTLESLVMLATIGLLVLLRFDAARFGAADYDDEESSGGLRTWLGRVSWYVFGVFFVVTVYFVAPQPLTQLHLQIGEPRGFVFLAGVGLAVLGMLAAAGYAWWRFGELRLPPRTPLSHRNPVQHRHQLHRRGDVARHPARPVDRLGLAGRLCHRLPGRPVRAGDTPRRCRAAARDAAAVTRHRPRRRLGDGCRPAASARSCSPTW